MNIIRLRRFEVEVEEPTLPIGTAFHERTFPLCHSLNYREWSGYYTVSVYEVHHEHEYNAIRNAAALIDISPLYKYLITGKDATRLVNRVITRDINKVKVGQVIYCCWCDEEGKVIDDGTISRLEENVYRWTAADPSLRWFRQNGLNMDVQIEDISEKVAALALQGPDVGEAAEGRCRSRHRQPEIFPRHSRQDRRRSRRHFPHRLHRRSGLRNLDAVERCRQSLGRARRQGQAVRSARRGHAGARRLPRRSRAAAHRSRLHEFEEGVDSVAEVFALRTGLRQDGPPRQRKLHRQARPRARREEGCAAATGRPRSRLDRRRATLRTLRPHSRSAGAGLARRGSRVFRREAGRQGDDDQLVSDPEED